MRFSSSRSGFNFSESICVFVQEAEFRPTQVLKVAGSATFTDTANGWAYLVNWERNGKADDESSDLEADAADRSSPQEASIPFNWII